MIEAIVSGLFLGGVLSLMVGPVFFMLIDTSLKIGMKSAALVALGVVLCDALMVLITFFSSNSVLFLRDHEFIIGLGGGVLLMIFGLVAVLRKPRIHLPEDIPPIVTGRPWLYLMKGFMMNLLNPFVLVFWLGVAGANMATKRFEEGQTVVFYISVLLIVFITDLIKAWLAARMKAFLRPATMHRIQLLSGLGLFAFGLRLVYKICLPG